MKKSKINKKSEKEKNIPFSMFSVRTGVGIFVATAISVYYNLTVFTRLYEKSLTVPSAGKKWMLAIMTFLIICLVDTVIILVYRRLTVKNPVLRILSSTEKIGAGDFSVRLPVNHRKHFRNEYDVMSLNINKMVEELAGIETLRQDFVSNVSHEFKAPLAVMQNSCTIIMQPDLSYEDRMKYAKNISDASVRLANMIANVLKLSKIESQKIIEKKDKINIAELFREEILVFQSIWEEKNIQIEVDADDNIEIIGDKELLSIMGRNLLSNAFKFAPENGMVLVSVKEDENEINISVADNGKGIPEYKLERIFEKFYQADISHAMQGNGLGLALVKSIADILGYKVSVESTLNVGSCFSITINK